MVAIGQLLFSLQTAPNPYGGCNKAIFIKFGYAAQGDFSGKLIIQKWCKRTSKNRFKIYCSLFLLSLFLLRIQELVATHAATRSIKGRACKESQPHK
jgi:hypothetical protein